MDLDRFPLRLGLTAPDPAATGNDTIRAGAGDDDIYGGEGADVLEGGIGDDTIDGDSDS